MEYLGRKVIKRKSDILLTSLDPKDLLDFIIQEDMLTEGERQIMMSEVTRQGRVRKTLEYLKRKKGGFDLLIRMLKHGRMEWLSMPLLQERDRIIAAGDDAHFINRMDQARITQRLSEEQCLQLGYVIAAHWKNIAYSIGFSYEDTNMIEMENFGDRTKVGYVLLCKWRQRKLDEANFKNLIVVIDEEGIDYSEEYLMGMFS